MLSCYRDTNRALGGRAGELASWRAGRTGRRAEWGDWLGACEYEYGTYLLGSPGCLALLVTLARRLSSEAYESADELLKVECAICR